MKTRRLIFTGTALLVLVAAGSVAWFFRARPEARAARLLSQARELELDGQVEAAERDAAAALKLDPQLAEAALLAARLNQQRLHRLSQAEQQYRAALQVDPDDPEANEGLARLLGLCARRSEAIPHVLRLVRQDAAGDLLALLARETGVISDRAALERARRVAPDDPSPLLGLAWHAAENTQPDEALELLQEAVRRQPGHAAAHVALGRQWLAMARFDKLLGWQAQLPPAAERFAETWYIRGRLAENAGDTPGAIRCYWESARRAPESKATNFRLARLLAETAETDASERFAAHVRRLVHLETMQDRVLLFGDHNNSDSLMELVDCYESAGRLWEAYGWCQLAVGLSVAPPSEEAWRTFDALRSKVDGLPLRLTADSANVALAIDLSGYPLPQFGHGAQQPGTVGSDEVPALSFRDDAAATGLRFAYFNGTSGPPTRRVFEFTGGGIGVLDFDLDGFADVFFTQGRPWPPGRHGRIDRESVPQPGDHLFRNRGGLQFEDVTDAAGLREDGFGQGVTAGDFNSDGFPDLYVANIGANRLWRNNGDGTVSDVTDQAGLAGVEWTTSCVVADLNGDALPDIYDVNYVTAPDVFERVCRHADGSPRLCLPFEFDGQPDRLWLNNGDGRFTDATADVLSVKPDGKGLGVAVWDAHGTGRLSLLVANDTTPCFFFVNEAGDDGGFRLREQGIAAGLALNGDGKATGCMGIALGDVNGDTHLEVHITNFLAEANTLFVNAGQGVYADRTRTMGLHAPTFDVLGFGTQFLDADLDGELELFVSNGHVDDLREQGKPYEMRPQLFRLRGSQFFEVAPGELGPYFETTWLGRPAARLDWNRDGREDLIVGHLYKDSALLTNTTPATGRFLSMALVGVASNRDAIGTSVTARIGERTIVRQLTAGDGYQASNERRLVFGAGDAAQIDELVVRWPSGRTQRFENVPVSRHVRVVEGQALLPQAY